VRIALLATAGNPYVLRLWIQSFQRFWRSEVDKLYVVMTCPVEQPVMRYMLGELAAAGAHLVPIPGLQHILQHGEGIAMLLDHCEDGHILLIEDDCFILRHGEVGRYFDVLAAGEVDIVASCGGSSTADVLRRAKQTFGVSLDPYYSPNMFFAGRSILRETDRHFWSRNWKKGDYIQPLDYICDQDECGDTLVSTSLQLRARGYRAMLIPQPHARPEDALDYQAGRGFFAEIPPWVHFGSLSGGTAAMMDQEGLVIAHRGLPHKGHLADIGAASALEWEKRLAMWLLCRARFPVRDPDAEQYNEVFDFAISNVLTHRCDVLDATKVAALLSAYSVLFAPLLVG